MVCSDEPPMPVAYTPEGERLVTGSLSFVPAVMGMIMAGEIVRELVIAPAADMR